MKCGLTVGGIEVEVTAAPGRQEAILADRYSPFLGAVSKPVCRVAFVDNQKGKGQPNPPLAAVSSNEHKVRIDHIDFDADLDLTGDGEVRIPADVYVVDHFFRLLYGLLAPRHNALLLHACGVISESHSHVFAGQSGAGKSTLASLAEHRPLLSDEHVIVRQGDAGWYAASTPFWGSYEKPGVARSAPLARLWSLRHWPSNVVRAQDALHTVRVALENSVLPSLDPELKCSVFDNAVDLAAAVPSSELRFTPSTAVWEHIDATAVA
jgi:hypothetical protein